MKRTVVLFLLVLSQFLGGSMVPVSGIEIDPPARSGALAPNIFTHFGKAYLTWLEPVEETKTIKPEYRLRWSVLDLLSPDGKSWSDPQTIVEGVEFFANWADLPSLVVNQDGTMLAHWLQKSGGQTFAYDIVLARSTDAGQSWRILGPVHFDGVKSEHGFVSLVPGKTSARAFWLDGRNMVASETESTGHGDGSMTLRTATISDSVSSGFLLDDRVCECCDTDAATTANGPIIVYRDRTMNETRDISIIRYDGHEWTKPNPVHQDHWVIHGCPVNGPAIAARDQLVAVAWFTGADGRSTIKVAFSRDAGATFAEPITVDDTAPLGRVDVVFDVSGSAIVSWLDSSSPAGALRICRINAEGQVSTPIKVSEVARSRSTGFPKMVLLGPKILLVWTDAGEAPTRLRATLLPLSSLHDSSQ